MSAEITHFPRKFRGPKLHAVYVAFTETCLRGLDIGNNRAQAANLARQIAATPATSHPEMINKVAAAQETAELYLYDDHPVTCFLNSVRDDYADLESEHPLSREIPVPNIDALTAGVIFPPAIAYRNPMNPVIAAFIELDTIDHEIKDLGAALGTDASGEAEKRWNTAIDQRQAVINEIMKTLAALIKPRLRWPAT